jgi:hypothetical protein
VADGVKSVTPAPGTTLYRLGPAPFRHGEVASVTVDHAGDLVGQGVVEHVPLSTPASPE